MLVTTSPYCLAFLCGMTVADKLLIIPDNQSTICILYYLYIILTIMHFLLLIHLFRFPLELVMSLWRVTCQI